MRTQANTTAWHLYRNPSQRRATAPAPQKHRKTRSPPNAAPALATSLRRPTWWSSPYRQKLLGASHNEKGPAHSWRPKVATTQDPTASRSRTGSECTTSSTYQLSATIWEELGHRIVPGPSHRPFPSWITAILPQPPVFRVWHHLTLQSATIPL